MMRSVMAVFVLVCAMAAGGCAADGGGGPKQSPDAAALRGWTLSLRVTETRTNRFLKYDLSDKGMLEYYAGTDSGPVWTGPLTGDELGKIADLLEANRETKSVATPKGDTPGRSYRYSARRGGAFFGTSYDSGSTPFLDELEHLLQGIQMNHRRDAFHALPAAVEAAKPGPAATPAPKP